MLKNTLSKTHTQLETNPKHTDLCKLNAGLNQLLFAEWEGKERKEREGDRDAEWVM